MAQVKIYGLRNSLNSIQSKLSDIVHETIVDVLQFPQEKRYHRFFKMEEGDMVFPKEKSASYTIIEIMMMHGRTQETKKQLIYTLFEKIENKLAIVKSDIEIVIIESEPTNWGFRGMVGDEIALEYKVKI